MIEIEYEGVDIGVEIDPDDKNPSEGGAASVRYFISKGDTGRNEDRVYISESTARTIADIDRNAWLRGIRDAIERIPRDER